MLKRSLLLTLVSTLYFSLSINAQPPCGFDPLHTKMLSSNAEYARQVNINEESIQSYIKAHPELLQRTERTEALYTIPVVVHVMHTGGAIGSIYNPSDAQIQGAINYLNQVFAGTYAGMQQPVEGGGVVNMELQFDLAQRTPSCGYTNGINRVDASSLSNYVANGVNAVNANGCPDVTLKNFSRWNTADYYNIWLVNKIDGADGTAGQFIAGYAYFPGASSSVDGTVMLATQMVTGRKTLPHEIGHAFNLYHTFEGSANDTQCPSNTNCNTQGDRICDTDPIYNNYNAGSGNYNFACRTGANTCASSNPYTINTESNFMSYTSCYTLFTNGQKARAQAAMSLSSRSSLVAPGNLALVPCGTNINFTKSVSTQTENSSGTLSGCRRYTDYTYEMTIGSAPTATATVTLSYGGSATAGLDYDVTTNGDFNSPSNILTFTSGSTTAQTFSVRIYDDSNVESTETIIIDFSINNGGGNGAKGTTSPTLTITLTDNDVAPTATSSNIFSIGVNAGSINGGPFDATLQSQRGQYLYRASELSAAGVTAGDITSFQLFINTKLSTRSFTNFSIKMAQTNTANLVDGSVTEIYGMSSVFSPSTVTTTNGWNIFTLNTVFAWNGTSNLAVEICFDNGTPDGINDADHIAAYLDGGNGAQGNMFFQNGINCSGSFSTVSYYPNGIKPIIRLGIATTGTAIETAAGATAANHITNGCQDYFYTNNNKLLFRLNNVNASLGCVNAILEAGGTVWVDAFSSKRSAKVFALTPTTNASSTNYTISLYFENAELEGRNPAALRIAKTTAATAAAANSSNTIFVTPTVTTLGSGITVFSASFTGFSRFFLVDAGATLPITLNYFTGSKLNNNNHLLNWKGTCSGASATFEIQRSADGRNFNSIYSVDGDFIRCQQPFDMTDFSPLNGKNFYRIKMTDENWKINYSHVILLLNSTTGFEIVSISPNPVTATAVLNISVAQKQNLQVVISDMKGSVVHQREIKAITGSNQYPINTSLFPPGSYLLSLSAESGENKTIKFIKH